MAFVGRVGVKDPGAQQDQWERLACRRERLYADDQQFRSTRPDDEIAAIGPQHGSSFDTCNTTNPHDDGISLDTFVDWMIAAGFAIEKIDDYASWLTRFQTAMGALPERQRAQSVLAVLDVYREPMTAVGGSAVPGARFQAAVQRAGRTIPHVSRQLIEKYLADLEGLGVLTK